MKLLVLVLSFAISGTVLSQRKMPNISFKHNSTEFADANRSLDENGQFADTLHDERLIYGLTKILVDNPELRIKLVGHSASNEMAGIALERAILVKKRLVKNGIDETRLEVDAEGSERPIISSETILGLTNAIEKEAALQRNRRVEIQVIDPRNQN